MRAAVMLGVLIEVAKASTCGTDLCQDCLEDGIYFMGNRNKVWRTQAANQPVDGVCASTSHSKQSLEWGFGAYRNGTEFSVLELGNPQYLCNGQQVADSLLSSNQTSTESNGVARLLHSRRRRRKNSHKCSSSLCDEMWENGYYGIPPDPNYPSDGYPRTWLWYKPLGGAWTAKCSLSDAPNSQFVLHRTNGKSELGVGAWFGGELRFFDALSCPAVRDSERRRLDVAEARHTARSPSNPGESSVLV